MGLRLRFRTTLSRIVKSYLSSSLTAQIRVKTALITTTAPIFYFRHNRNRSYRLPISPQNARGSWHKSGFRLLGSFSNRCRARITLGPDVSDRESDFQSDLVRFLCLSTQRSPRFLLFCFSALEQAHVLCWSFFVVVRVEISSWSCIVNLISRQSCVTFRERMLHPKFSFLMSVLITIN